MNESDRNSRVKLVRESVVFQLKLMVDGFRDVVLVPVSLAATLLGLLFGGDRPDGPFRRVIEIGRKTEAWINLFGHHAYDSPQNGLDSLDGLLEKTEESVMASVKRPPKPDAPD